MAGCDSCPNDTVCLVKLINLGFSKLKYIEKQDIIRKGRCTPELNLTQKKDTVTRNFHSKYYETYQWLCGCVHTNRLFCFPCLLFNTTSTVWTKTGYIDLNNLHNAIKKHQGSEAHLDSCVKYYSFGKVAKTSASASHNSQYQLLNNKNIEIHNAKVEHTRNTMRRLIDIICFLVKQDIAFCGSTHDESDNKGIFLETTSFLAKYDGVLESHMVDSTSSITEISNTQNDLICSIAAVVSNHIREEINQTEFVAVIVEDAMNVSGQDQLALILRYFSDGEVVDRFIKYIEISEDRSAVTLSNLILDTLEELECCDKVVAQTYDGATIISSTVNEVQELVKQKCPLALSVWCSTHKLNFVLSKCLEHIPEAKCFFGTIKAIADFFHSSTKRNTHYNNFVKMKMLPHDMESRWAYNSRTVNTIKREYLDLIKVFVDMYVNATEWDAETIAQVSGFLLTIKEFEFVFLLNVLAGIFDETDTLDNKLNPISYDITYCAIEVKEFDSFLPNYKKTFQTHYNEAVAFAGPPKRKNTQGDYVDYCQRLFCQIIDSLHSVLLNRYQNITLLKFFELLSSEKFDINSKLFRESELQAITTTYNIDFDIIKNELRSIYKSPVFSDCSIYEIIQFIQKNNLVQVLPKSLQLAKLIVTIPASSASCEKSFSSLKRVQTYLRNTKNQQRMTALTILSIEKQLLENLKRKSSTFYDSVLKEYLNRNIRVDLIYK